MLSEVFPNLNDSVVLRYGTVPCFVQGPHLPSSSTGALSFPAEPAGGGAELQFPSRRRGGGRAGDALTGRRERGTGALGALRRGRCGGARAALPWRSPPPLSRSASWARATGECGGPWQGGHLCGRRGPAFPGAVPARALLSVPARRRGRASLRVGGREATVCRRWNTLSPGRGGLWVALVPCGRARPAVPGGSSCPGSLGAEVLP